MRPCRRRPAEGEGRSLRTRNKFAAHVPSFRRFRAVNVAHAICVGGAQQVPYTCAGGRSGRLPARHCFTRAASDRGVRLTHAKRRTPARTSSPPCCGRGARAVSSPRDASLGATAVVWPAIYSFQSVSQTAREALASRVQRSASSWRSSECLGLWWRLSSGPIELDLATPWLKAAIEENFGGSHIRRRRRHSARARRKGPHVTEAARHRGARCRRNDCRKRPESRSRPLRQKVDGRPAACPEVSISSERKWPSGSKPMGG